MKHTITWVVTFDGAEARAFQWDRAGRKLGPIDLGVEAGARRPSHDDRPGRVYASAGDGTARGAGDPSADAERELEEAFVASIVDALTRRAARHEFQRLIIAAPPRALGAFRAHAPPALTSAIQCEIGRDYVHTPPATILDRLEEQVVP